MNTYEVSNETRSDVHLIECDYYIFKSEYNQILFIKRKENNGNIDDYEPKHDLVASFPADKYYAKKTNQ